MLHTYEYDELNRLLKQQSYNYYPDSTQLPGRLRATDNYYNELSYDANGNIITLVRNGELTTSTPLTMDSLYYKYYDKTNKLMNIGDNINPNNYGKDIDNQTEIANYEYDETGNLVKDNSENMTISWNIANKPVEVKNNNTQLDQFYFYDPSGARVIKYNGTEYKVYIRDASGNLLAMYSKKSEENAPIYLENSYIYGSSRLGEVTYTEKKDDVVGNKHDRFRGMRHYELNNHLGNIMAIITDRKHGIDTDQDNYWEYNLADVAAINDYYPGGMLMPGRSYNSNSYRFGMNGQEKDDEIAGIGNIYSAEYWEYDSRSIRRWNLDPKPSVGTSDYSCFNNNPILFADPTGESGEATIDKKSKTVTISANIILYGSKASQGLADRTASQIQDEWNKAAGTITIDKVEYAVKFNIKGSYLDGDQIDIDKTIQSNTDIKNNFFRVENSTELGGSYLLGLTNKGGNSGAFKFGELQGRSSTAVHEFGHGLGLEHTEGSFLFRGQPDIMVPRNTSVSAPFRMNNGTNNLNPELRLVTKDNIMGLNLSAKFSNGQVKANVGRMNNIPISKPINTNDNIDYSTHKSFGGGF